MAVLTARHVVVIATPTVPLLSALLHALSHTPDLEVTVLTRETTTQIPIPEGHAQNSTNRQNSHGHGHGPSSATSRIRHVTTSFEEAELATLFKAKDTVVCCLVGADVHLSPQVIKAAQIAGVARFLPSEYGLDTGNERIRALLPPYQTRFEVQRRLKCSAMRWTAIYSGLALEDALMASGSLGIDVLWASVGMFPHDEEVKVAFSSREDVASAIVEAILHDGGEEGGGGGGTQVYVAGFLKGLEEVIHAVEGAIGRELDRYVGSLEGARKEAQERMRRGFFDGAVALLGRVAVWDRDVGAWGAWEDGAVVEKSRASWDDEISRVVRMIMDSQVKGDTCGC